jgi:hypothetical protein
MDKRLFLMMSNSALITKILDEPLINKSTTFVDATYKLILGVF